jgi:hypothetical protein
MLALAGDEVLMDERSTLGPIDPQIVVHTPQGASIIPAQNILDGFEKARDAIEHSPEVLPAYLPLLNRYDLHIFEICRDAIALAKTLAQTWLESYMFKNLPDKSQQAKRTTEELSEHRLYLSHGRTIGIQKAEEIGLIVHNLKKYPKLRKALWELYCAIDLYFDRVPAAKLYENARGVSWAKLFQPAQITPPPSAQQPASSSMT